MSTEIPKEFVYLRFRLAVAPDTRQENILVTNDTPPSACIADFDFITLAPHPDQPTLSSEEFTGTLRFMPPECLAPEKFGIERSEPTREVDIYAFAMTIFQVSCSSGFSSAAPFNFVQVLAGEPPFRDLNSSKLVYSVIQGERPQKPQNAPAIGFSDSLWDFVKRCWDGDRTRRPLVAEAVERLHLATLGWHTLMPVSVISLVNLPLNLPPLRLPCSLDSQTKYPLSFQNHR